MKLPSVAPEKVADNRQFVGKNGMGMVATAEKVTGSQGDTEKYGWQMISAALHVDEATPYIHVVPVPMYDRGKLNCRDLDCYKS